MIEKKHYYAKFKDGMELARTSTHDYRTAWKSVDYAQKPPRCIGTGFSCKDDPPVYHYQFGSMGWLSANERARETKRRNEANSHIRMEVVKVQRLNKPFKRGAK